MFSNYLARLFTLLIALMVGSGVGALINLASPDLNPGLMLMLVLLGTTGILMLIDSAIISLARFQANRRLKKLGYNSAEEAISALQEYSNYKLQIMMLPPEAQDEIIDKSKRTQELIKDYESRPPFYFDNMGMTKEQAIEQVRTDYNNWFKQKGYPFWEPKIKDKQ